MTAAPEGDSSSRRCPWGPRWLGCRPGPGKPGAPPRVAAAPSPQPLAVPSRVSAALQWAPPGPASPSRGGAHAARRGRWRRGRDRGGREGPRRLALGWAGAARAAPGPGRRGLLPARRRRRRAPPRAPARLPAPPRAAAVPRVALPRDGPRASALPLGAHGGAAAAALGGRAAAAAAAPRVRGRLGPSGRRQHVGYEGKSCRPGPAPEPTR